MIDRRGFARIALASCFVLPFVVSCADDKTTRRIGILATGSPTQDIFVFEDLAALLRELGWIEGKNLAVERRYADWQLDRLGPLAQELVDLKVDLIIGSTDSTLAAKKVTTKVPIVMPYATDPVAMGIVASLSRPGGNITGYAAMGPEAIAQRAQVVHEVLPAANRIAYLAPEVSERTTRASVNDLVFRHSESAYRSLGVEPIAVKLALPYGNGQVANAIAEAASRGARAIDLYLGDQRAGVDAASAHRLPVIAHSAGAGGRRVDVLRDRSR